MTNIEGSEKLQMNEGGESINGYLKRTGGDIKDYEQALSNYKLNIANEKGLTNTELHEKSLINPEIAKQIFIIAKLEIEGGGD